MSSPKDPMVPSSPNPCTACSIGQDCCTHLAGLRVTERELVRCFGGHTGELRIERQGPMYSIAAKNGGPCPNWQNGGCSVYDVRPRDCRLFPFTIFVRQQRAGAVSLGYHSDTRCPLKETLLPSDGEAGKLVRAFAAEAFPDAAITVAREGSVEGMKRRALAFVRRLLGRSSSRRR